MNHQHCWRDRHARYGREIIYRIERHLLVKDWSNGERDTRKVHRVAVRRRFGDNLRGNHAAAPRPVVDNHLLGHAFGELLADDARYGVRATARHERHHDPYRPVWIGLLREYRSDPKGREPCERNNERCNCAPDIGLYCLRRHDRVANCDATTRGPHACRGGSGHPPHPPG